MEGLYLSSPKKSSYQYDNRKKTENKGEELDKCRRTADRKTGDKKTKDKPKSVDTTSMVGRKET